MYTRQQSTLHTDRDGIYARGFAGRDTHMLHPRIIYRMAAMQCESGQACHRPPPLPATHPDRRLSTDTAIRSSGSGLAWLLTVWKSSPSGQCAVRPLTQRAPCIATTAAYLSIDCVSTYGTYLRQCCAGVCSVCRVRAHLSSDGPTADADADAWPYVLTPPTCVPYRARRATQLLRASWNVCHASLRFLPRH